MKKYLLISGIINSKHDGDEHLITAHQLCKLYKLPPRECIFADKEDNLLSIDMDNLIILRPRFDGNYNLEVYDE